MKPCDAVGNDRQNEVVPNRNACLFKLPHFNKKRFFSCSPFRVKQGKNIHALIDQDKKFVVNLEYHYRSSVAPVRFETFIDFFLHPYVQPIQ
jgi:hypothetical protein